MFVCVRQGGTEAEAACTCEQSEFSEKGVSALASVVLSLPRFQRSDDARSRSQLLMKESRVGVERLR